MLKEHFAHFKQVINDRKQDDKQDNNTDDEEDCKNESGGEEQEEEEQEEKDIEEYEKPTSRCDDCKCRNMKRKVFREEEFQ
jgi:hypothetical protein